VISRAARVTADAGARQLLWDWCGEALDRKGWLYALIALAELAGEAVDPAWLWRLRCRLHANANRDPDSDGLTPQELACRRWHWALPDDLAQRGWDADLALWLACRRVEAARPFRRLIAHSPRPRHLATLARHLVARGESAEPVIHRALCRALAHRPPRSAGATPR